MGLIYFLLARHRSRNTVHGYIIAVTIERHINHLRTKDNPLNLNTLSVPASKHLPPVLQKPVFEGCIGKTSMIFFS